MRNDRATHPSDATLAAYVDGNVDAATRLSLLEHLESCGDCMAAVLAANESRAESAPSRAFSRSRWWMAAAAAVLIVIAAVPLLRRRADPVSRLVALAPRSVRVAEPRLTGGFPWAAYRGARRSNNAAVDNEMLRLSGAAGDLAAHADSTKTPEAEHAAGIAMVLIDKPAEAMRRLETAARRSGDAAAWSDLAAARYAAAEASGNASLYHDALPAVDAALKRNPKLPEALFNRALILERLGLAGEARKAWLRYLEVDGQSEWATEARAHLRDLPAATRSSTFERDRPLLEQAAASGDAERVRELAGRYRQQARAYAEGEYLGRWGEAVRASDSAAAARWLAAARQVGEAVHRLSGESLLRDAVASIDSATPAQRAAIAEGHVLYRRGRVAYSRQAPAEAERDLRLAAARFGEGGSPMALLARYYAAGARLAQNDVAGARRELEQTTAEADVRPRFMALGAAVRWELARAHVLADDWAGALPILEAGAALYRRLGEHAGEAFLESMAAGALATLGRYDESWQARIRAFRALSAEGDDDLTARSVGSAMDAELRAGRHEAALSLSAVALDIQGPAARPLLVVDTLIRKALLEATMERPGDARTTAAEAERAAARIPDAAVRARTLADIGVATGAALVATEPRRAADALSAAIEFYRVHGLRSALPEPLLFRARAALRLHDAGAAQRDLDAGIAAVEERRGGPEEGTPAHAIVAAERSLFQAAIGLAVARGDAAGAFAYAERSRGGAMTLEELQRRLEGSDVTVLEIAALPGELVTVAVTSRDVAMGRSRASGEELARAAWGSDARSALAALYDAIVRPVEPLAGRAGRLVFVADPLLEGVPFAALYDRVQQRYLVERAAVAVAPAAAALVRDGRAPRAASIIAVGLPSGDETRFLSAIEREVQDVARVYPRAVAIASREATWPAFQRALSNGADVVHIAGHAERQQGAGDDALLFAGGPGTGLERITWKSVGAAPRVHAEVIVLAACETMRRPLSAHVRARTLAEAFAAAGARDVAGTLVPIADRDARDLFLAFHRSLFAGRGAADALRAVQVAAIRQDGTRGSPEWAGVAVLSTRIPVH